MHRCQHADMAADPSLAQLADALNGLYRFAGSARLHARAAAATGVDVTRTGLRFLSLVAEDGPVSGTRLASALEVSQPTASRVLQQLEADGLVVREPSSTDGRASSYAATRKGRRSLQKVRDYHIGQLAQALADVPPRKRTVLTESVTELVRLLSGRAADVDRRTA